MQTEKINKAGNLLPIEFKNSDQQAIRTVVLNDQPMFVAKDVFKTLGISWYGQRTLSKIPDNWKGVVKLTTPSGVQSFNVINEPAMYKVAFRSNKPEADKFTNWVASEVLPEIRKTGSYELNLSGLPIIIVNDRQLIPYRELLSKLGLSTGGSAYVRTRKYPNHFLSFSRVLYVSREMAQYIAMNKMAYKKRQRIKYMDMILPRNFGTQLILKGVSQ
ncbi:MAG: hypothetical protein KGZ82_10685 [Bacteroidales bacterium]|nr:hypothetical protein [Bacteroidales bacterium]